MHNVVVYVGLRLTRRGDAACGGRELASGVTSWAGWILVPGITNAVWQQAFARDYAEVTTAPAPPTRRANRGVCVGVSPDESRIHTGSHPDEPLCSRSEDERLCQHYSTIPGCSGLGWAARRRVYVCVWVFVLV